MTICHKGGTLTVAGTTFNVNAASSSGGAIYAAGTLTLGADNTITGNEAGEGGAIYLPDTSSAILNITGATTFSQNTATTNGGAIFAERSSRLNFTADVSITENEAVNGGGIWIRAGSQLSGVSGALSFTDNTADYGGGLYVAIENTSTVTLSSATNYTFEGNEATYDGGAIYTVQADVVIDGQEITAQNTVGNGGGFVRAGGTVTVTNSTISGQHAQYGGAIYSLGGVTVTDSVFTQNVATVNDGASLGGGGAIYVSGMLSISSSDFNGNRSASGNTYQGGGAIYLSGDAAITGSIFQNNTHTNNANIDNGGGAIYVNKGSLTIDKTRFVSNGATGSGGSRGGAIYAFSPATASTSTVITITDSYFQANRAVNNGGSVVFLGPCTSRLTNVTFLENISSGAYGGAVYAQGSLTLTSCYFNANRSAQSGGAVYFNQRNNANTPGTFTSESTMYTSNTAGSAPLNGQGGALYLQADVVLINRNTFDTNQSATTNGDSRGGAVYVDTNDSASATVSSIKNSVFYNNQVYGGSTNYGGGIYMTGEVSIISCAFTKNSAIERGGAVYVGNGTLTITASILAGNTADNGRDIYSDGNITSRGYNRVGIYGKGGTDTSWVADITTSTTDRENSAWSTATFWGADAELRQTDDYYTAPKVGCTMLDAVYLVALVLNEATDLAESDRATNVIPFARRFTLNVDQYDIWGVDRFASQNDISVGPHYYGGSGGNNGGDDGGDWFDIRAITMSGIPNTLKTPGQTASLVAVIHYMNGRTAYGVPYNKANPVMNVEEPVRWSSSLPNFIDIDENGNITAYRQTPASGATITVRTVRKMPTSLGGREAEASRVVIVEGTYDGYMNISPNYISYWESYVATLEHDISVAMADVDTTTLNNGVFKRNFSASWSVNPGAITELTTSTPYFDKARTYSGGNGLTASKAYAVAINFPGRNNGDVFPLEYSWTFTGSELQELLGHDLTGKTINAALADELFSKLRIDYQGTSTQQSVIGTSGIKASDAMNAGVLTLTKSDGEAGVRVGLTAYLANLKTTGNNDGPQLVSSTGTKKLLIVPDGASDGAITGSMWMLQSSSSTGGNSGGTTNTKSGDGGGGGGGCASMSLGLLGLLLLLKRR